MKKVIIFTSAMAENDFRAYQESAIKKSNPSNQNFYSRLIKSLSTFNDVSVISHRPISNQMFRSMTFEANETTSENVNYYYSKVSTKLTYKLFDEFSSIYKTAIKCINEINTNDFVIIVDVLRYNLLKAAKKIGKKFKVPVIGMLTDNPKNLTGARSRYIDKIFANALNLDGYLSLSQGLLNVFNKENKPSYIFKGLVETNEPTKKEPLGDYLFFSGSLYERYGVKTMVDAYLASTIKQKLIICGSGPLKEYISSLEAKDSRILYLSQLEKNKIISLQQHAIANINPRPINEKLDSESVPSKLLEYFSSGVPTISTKHIKLYDTFKDDAIWFDDGNFDSLKLVFDNFSTYDYHSLLKMASTAKVKVYELYDIRVQGEAISHFIDSFIASENK